MAFRYSMQREAEQLGVAGWVRNLPDRSVAFCAEGPSNAVDSLVTWCRSGPALAKVDDVSVEPADVQSFHGFEILP